MGEYAAHTKDRKNSLEAALGEAVFMMGMERNADQVRMAAYAPLFSHVDAWQWKPDLIWVDNLRTMGTPSYYVQQLFSLNRGDKVLPVSVDGGEKGQLFSSAVLDEKSGEVILKLVNLDAKPAEVSLDIAGLKTATKSVHRLVLSAENKNAENTLDAPRQVSPRESDEPNLSATQTLPANSFTILRIGTK